MDSFINLFSVLNGRYPVILSTIRSVPAGSTLTDVSVCSSFSFLLSVCSVFHLCSIKLLRLYIHHDHADFDLSCSQTTFIMYSRVISLCRRNSCYWMIHFEWAYGSLQRQHGICVVIQGTPHVRALTYIIDIVYLQRLPCSVIVRSPVLSLSPPLRPLTRGDRQNKWKRGNFLLTKNQ